MKHIPKHMRAKSLSKAGIACFSHVAVDIAEARTRIISRISTPCAARGIRTQYAAVGGLGRTCERDWR